MFLLSGFVGTVIALLSLQEVRRRSQVFKSGLAIGMAVIALAVFQALLKQYEPAFILPLALAALSGGLLSAVLVLLVLLWYLVKVRCWQVVPIHWQQGKAKLLVVLTSILAMLLTVHRVLSLFNQAIQLVVFQVVLIFKLALLQFQLVVPYH